MAVLEKRIGYVVRKIISKIDVDGDGTVSVKEAISAMRGAWQGTVQISFIFFLIVIPQIVTLTLLVTTQIVTLTQNFGHTLLAITKM